MEMLEMPRHSGVTFTFDHTDDPCGVWVAEVVIFTSSTEFFRVFIEAPSQTLCKEAALALLKPAVWGHKRGRNDG